jgi:hypothetical protein
VVKRFKTLNKRTRDLSTDNTRPMGVVNTAVPLLHSMLFC